MPGFFKRRVAAARQPLRVRLGWRDVEVATHGRVVGDEGEFYLRDGAIVRLQAQLDAGCRLPGGTVDFLVTARNPRGNLTPVLPVAQIIGVPLSGDGAHAEIPWGLRDRAALERWAFSTFRFTVRVKDRAGRRVLAARPLPSSPPLRHYASVAGLYGFGPTGEIFSNAEIRRLARLAGGVPLRRRAPAALRRLAAQMPPGREPGVQLFGYSLGGHAAVELARLAGERGVAIELLIAIDPVVLSGKPLVVPTNVRRAVSWYQRNGGRLFFLRGRTGCGVPLAAADPMATQVENFDVSRLPSGLPTMHEDMPFLVSERLLAALGVETSPTQGRRAASIADLPLPVSAIEA